VVAVVGLAAAGFFLWLPAGLDKASLVAASLLVVTCPCAIGLAIPLAYELAQASLRRRGFFARSEDLLDRLTRVRTILFDKTGTLTLGRLEVAEPERLQALEPFARRLLYNLAVRSAHPVSSAVAGRLDGEAYDETLRCVEVPGQGVECETPAGAWRFGRPSWAVDGGTPGEPFHGATLSLDRQPVLRLATREEARPRAAVDLSVLRAEGYSLWLLSGDARDRVARFARAVGLPSQVALGDLSPEDKAAWVARLDRDDTLFLGDGVNDALAFTRAFVAGTPAADRPVIPSRSDFFLVGEGLTPLREAFATARRLRRVVSRLVALSVIYNVAAVAAGLAGWMTPLLAAVTMPTSTLLLLAITVWSLRDGPRLGDWRGTRGAGAARAPAAWPEFEGGRA
jgi:Cu2+-exporting ATPase